MRLRNSFWAMLGRDTSEASALVVERIRKTMLLTLDEHGHDGQDSHYALDIKINFAQDIAELWYLRPDLMNAIAATRGEVEAQQVMESVTALFKGHFSAGWR